MDEEDHALSQLLLNAASPSPFFTSPTQSPAPEPLPQVQQRPISKRRGKKRSARACGACRTRKVRCNIVAHGPPCSNCRHDEVDCVLPLSRRQKSARERTKREEREQSIRDASFDAEFEDGGQGNANINPTPRANNRPSLIVQSPTLERAQSILNTYQLAPHGMAISEHPLAEIFPMATINASEVDSAPPPTSSRTKSCVKITPPLASSSTFQTTSPQVPKLPNVFIPFPRHLDTHDLSYLNSRDALTLPPEFLQIALLNAFVEFVYPQFPLLDLEKFFSAIKCGLKGLESEKRKAVERESAGKIQVPFLLFQAVMYSGVEFVGLGVLKDAGYKNREDAKNAFFTRAKLLYDFDTSIDRLSIIQSLLLMTLFPPASHEMKDSWHWLGLAISLSYSLGLNRLNTQQSSDLGRKHLERRVWWTAFIRDRTLAFESETGWVGPMRIKREDCDVEILSLHDFELGRKDQEGNEGIEQVKIRRNAEACVEKAKLCWCCDEILVTNFAPQQPPVLPPQPRFHIQRNTMLQSTEILRPFESNNFPTSFESQEELKYHIPPSSSSPSASGDCVTPGGYDDAEGDVICSSPLGARYGVDGEYNDYLEFLRDPVLSEEEALIKTKDKEKESSNWAFQLDCENDLIIEL